MGPGIEKQEGCRAWPVIVGAQNFEVGVGEGNWLRPATSPRAFSPPLTALRRGHARGERKGKLDRGESIPTRCPGREG